MDNFEEQLKNIDEEMENVEEYEDHDVLPNLVDYGQHFVTEQVI